MNRSNSINNNRMIIRFPYVIVPLVLFLGLYGVCDEVLPKSSLSFVIDITLSMGTVIETVKSQVNAIFDAITNSPDSPIENFVLVLFADPNVYAALVTTDREKFQITLQSIKLENGSNCPELAMTGIKTAIDASLRGSYVYVFTDASARDFDKFEEVKRVAQEKECQMTFILTSKCVGETEFSENYNVYPKLAEATSGQVFHIFHVSDLNKILKYVKHSIKSHTVPVFSKKYPSGDNELEVESDSKIKELIVAITSADRTDAAYIVASITGPEEEPIDDDALVRMGEILILKVSESTPGMYKVEFSCEVPSYVVVTARSDVKFQHGFSLKLVSSLDVTVFNPFSAYKNYLFIKLFGENTILTYVKLLDLNYHILLELPLTIQNDKHKLYVTELFDPPSSKFRIAVKGLDTEKNTNLTRFGSLVLETEKFEHKAPVVKIKGDSKITLDFNSKVQLNCTVEAYPEPNIVWKDLDDRREVPSMLSRAPPYNFFRILDLIHLVNNKTYECFAESRLGNDSKMLQVEVKPKPFIQIQEPESKILDYGSKGVLHCKVKSFPQAKIFWLYDNQKTVLVKHGDIVLSPDNSSLTINFMNPQTRGRYGCLIEYQGTYRVKYANITLSSRAPKFERPLFLKMTIREGEDTKLTCRLLKGEPQADIKWYRKLTLNPSAKFEELPLNRNQTSFIIKNANIFDTSVYKCFALNIVGFEIRIIRLYVECKPSVEIDTPDKIVERGTDIKLKCSVQGLPTPEVTWYKNGTPLRTDLADNIKVLKHNSLRMKTNLHHTGTYTCRARNKLGSATSSVNVTVHFLEITPPINTKFKKERRTRISIQCRDYVKGVPKPTLNWLFYDYNAAVPKKLRRTRKGPIRVTDDYLQITNLQRKHRGNYTCVASNIGQSKNITFEVDVLFPPQIINSRTSYRAVVGDRLLKILCNATGNPEPTITWYKNGLTLAAVDKKTFFNKFWLVIQHVDISDAGDYICEASNSFRGTRSTTGIFNVVVNEFPLPDSIKATMTMLVAKGSNALIRCALPHIKFDTVHWYKDRKIIYKGELKLRNAKLSDSGIYTCRVNKLDSSITESANTYVIVGLAPTFVNKPTSKVEMYATEDVYLDCLVPAKIESTVNWWHNGNKIAYSGMMYSFKMEEIYVGEFKCEAANKFGTVQRTFDLVLREFTECVLQIDSSVKNLPLMLTTSGAWPKFKTTERHTTIPKLQTIILSCSTLFTMFEETYLIATCFGETNFLIENKVIDFAAIKCKEDIKPTYIEPKRDGANIPCRGKHTTTAILKFGVEPKAIDALEYCLDREYNPIYAKYIMRFPADYIANNMTMWDGTNLDRYSCDNQRTRFSAFTFDMSKCCFANRYLVNPKDMFPGQLQRATYNRLNIVPHWSTCHSENWDAVEEKVRKLAKEVNNDLIIYTGTAEKLTLNDKFGRKTTLTFKKQHVATYLWKVVQNPATQSSIAIIQLNIPEIQRSEVKTRCTDICHQLPWMEGTNWHHIGKGYTYCCELRDFIHKFHFAAIPFKPYFNLLKS